MLLSKGALRAFDDETQVCLSVVRELGSLRQAEDKDGFVRTFVSVGGTAEEAIGFWDVIDVSDAPVCSFPVNWEVVKSNTDLVDQFGVRLNSEVRPRNELLYRLTELFFGDLFQFTVTGSRHVGGSETKKVAPEDRRIVSFTKAPVWPQGTAQCGNPMAIHTLLSGQSPSDFSHHVLRGARTLCDAFLPSEESLALELTDLLLSCRMEIPSLEVARALRGALLKGMAGETVHLVGAFCPDYSYEETGDPQIPYRYTFDGVGTGVGLVAQQFLRILPELSRFLAERGIDHRFVLGIGDFESDQEAILEQVGVDREEFIERCSCSLDAFRDSVPDNVPLDLELFAGQRSRNRLYPYAKEAFSRMVKDDFGSMERLYPNYQEILNRLPDQFRSFYERWYGRSMDDFEVRQIVYQQGSEYAAVARIYEEDFEGPLVHLAGDRPEMNKFNAFFSGDSATLCAKRTY